MADVFLAIATAAEVIAISALAASKGVTRALWALRSQVKSVDHSVVAIPLFSRLPSHG